MMKKMLYIDVTGILKAPVLTGADKISAGITVGIINNNIEPCLIAFSKKHNSYVAIDKYKYYSYITGNMPDDEGCYTDTIVRMENMERDSVFLDAGNSWLNIPQRGWLLPKIRNNNVQIISVIQSFLPITHPERVSDSIRIKFMHYITACLSYADKIIVPCEETAGIIRKLSGELKISSKPVIIVHFCIDSEVIRNNTNTLADMIPQQIFSKDELSYFVKAYKRFKNILTEKEHTRNFQKKLRYRSPKCAEAAGQIIKIAGEEENDILKRKPVKQIVYLSARPEALLDTLPYIEKFMTFIEEMLIFCPESAGEYLKANYKGKLRVKIITDDELLEGCQLPEDHTTRNFFLRCLMMNRDELDEEFIMSDDDYRPLTDITEETFFSQGMYNAYYFIDIENWKHTVGELFSYDYSLFRTLEFLKKNGYPSLQYSAHQPQIINRDWYRQFISEHDGIILKGYDEWSTYFNFCAVKHKKYFRQLPYVTLGWPNVGTCWQHGVSNSSFLFENFYEDNYNENGVFAGLSVELNENTVNENKIKTSKAFSVQADCRESFRVYDEYVQQYVSKYDCAPAINIFCSDISENDIDIYVPHFYRMSDNVINNLRFYISRSRYTVCNNKKIIITASIQDSDGNIISTASVPADPVQTETGCHLKPSGDDMKYMLNIRCQVEGTDICTEANTPLEVV